MEISHPNYRLGLVCEHTSHLFQSPFCSKQSLIKRIANTVFHIFTIAIPLIVYKTYIAVKQKIEKNGISQNPSPLAQEAINKAKSLIPLDTVPFKFSAGWNGPKGTHQPINQEIARLTSFYWDECFEKFEKVIKESPDNPWNQPSVIEAADQLMDVAFTISCLTLEDLDPFVENLASKGIKRSKEKALTEQDSYMYRTFYYCTKAYHMARGAISWGQNPFNPDNFGLFYPEEKIPEEHEKLFYEKGTIQNRWRCLYNEYCDRVKLYVNLKKLEYEDGRHVHWTIKDSKPKNFCQTPDTEPT